MAKASLKVVLHNQVYSDGSQSVMLQCIISGPGIKPMLKRKTICRVKKRDFNEKDGEVKRTDPFHKQLNAKINEESYQARTRLLELESKRMEPDADYILRGSPAGEMVKTGLLAHGLKYVERCKQKGQVRTAEKYEGHISQFARFLGNPAKAFAKDVSMGEVTEDLILKFVKWLRENGVKSENTLHRRMAFFTTLFNDARKRGLVQKSPMEFLEFKEVKTRKPKLTPAQLDKLAALELTGKEDDARNTFMLQFYCYGARIGDALQWKRTDVQQSADGWYLEYDSQKTNDLISVRLSAPARKLIERYLAENNGPFLLPWLRKYQARPDLTDAENYAQLLRAIESSSTSVNSLLKTIAEKAEIPIRLTTHVARHSFATLADSKVADKRKISAALGHSKFSTTEIYLSELRQTDVNDAMDAVFGEE